ncbi:hypothetical protein U1Q18_011658 [Sarracenia purpurea var. burkii]
MDAFDIDNVKAEKATAMRRYNRFRTVARFFRIAEICLVLVLLSWISARLPFAAKISGEYFRKLIAVIVSPPFIFLISNAIVITLLAKSGKTPAVDNAEPNLYDEFVKNIETGIDYETESCPPVPATEEIVYQDKQIISDSEMNNITPKRSEVPILVDTVSGVKTLKRSQTENLKREISEKPCGSLRRSVTDKCLKVMDSGEVPAETLCLVDELSNEEFQRTVEDFIAKQVKFHKEEKLAIVTCKAVTY